MPNFAPLKIEIPSFQNALDLLRKRGFTVTPTQGGVYQVSKNQCTASVEVGRNLQSRILAYPAVLVSGEPASLVDRGYQKFLKTKNREIPVTADQLEALHTFSEELKVALGYTSLYNEGLGSVSARYQYDRVASRDLPPASRPRRPWQP